MSSFGIQEPTLTKILELDPEAETARRWIDYAIGIDTLDNPAGFVASRLLAGDPPPANEKPKTENPLLWEGAPNLLELTEEDREAGRRLKEEAEAEEA